MDHVLNDYGYQVKLFTDRADAVDWLEWSITTRTDSRLYFSPTCP